MGLPLPKGVSATQKSKVKSDDLPVGGAPPVTMPNFADAAAQRRAVPARVEEQQLPVNNQRRSPEEVKADFEAATALISKGMEGAAETSTETAPEPPKPESSFDEDDGPTFGDLRGSTSFDWDEYHATLQETSDFRRPEIRKAVEARCTELNIEDLILYESVSQRQVIIPGKLEPVFRSLTTLEDLALKQWVYELRGSDRYILDTLMAMTLTMGLKAFNDVDLPDHMKKDESGERAPDKELFEAKMKIVKNLGSSIVGILVVTYKWFDERVRRTLITGVLGK